MKILAIETSCDDTGISILEVKGTKMPKFTVLSNIVSSQQIHQNYGGVFPMMAKREHQTNLVPVLVSALTRAKLVNSGHNTAPGSAKSKILNPKSRQVEDPRSQSGQIPNSKLQILKKILEKESTLFESVKKFLETHEKPDIDMIAITHGPGLEPCLWVGVNFAKALSYFWDIPVIPVNHIEAHIAVNFLPKINGNPGHKTAPGFAKSEILNPKTTFPAVALIVSGGHTQLILVKKIGKYEIIGETRDDAAGECFDKAARILNLGYPGGPAIAKLAEQWKSQISNSKSQINPKSKTQNSENYSLTLPRPMMYTKDYDFSFSGLKTSVLYAVRDKYGETPLRQGFAGSDNFVSEMCFAVQDAICDVLIKKTIAAAKTYKAKTIILGGGVSANKELRKQLQKRIEKEIPNTKYLIPDTSLSTDNGLMIAVAGYFNRNKKTSWQKLKVNSNLRIG